MSAYYNEGIQVIVGNGQNFPGTPRVSLIPFIQRAYDKGLLNFTTLPPGSISLAEIQNISTSKLLGRSTAGTGVIEELTIGTGLSLAGGILSNTATASPPGGSNTQIQYNNAGAFAGSSQLIANIGATNTLDITGSGSTNATNALRVRNSSGTNLLTLNNASGATMVGADTSTSTYVISATNLAGGGLFRVRNSGSGFEIGDWTGLGHSSALRFTRPSGGTLAAFFSQDNANFTFNDNSYGFQIISNTTASKPALHFTGTGYSGGTATTTKPTLLIEPTGTTSTGWSTSGTKLGVNAESGFTGYAIDVQLNGTTKFRVDGNGNVDGALYSGRVAIDYINNRNSSYRCLQFSNSNANTIVLGLAQFEGTTSSYPALKRNGTGLDIRLANDSGYAPLASSTMLVGGSTLNTNSQLQVNSTSKGFLPPVMTTTQRDAVTWVAGDAGMIIFNTTLVKLQVWNGSAWETVTSL
jgi:hypothetical protein